ncbi:hypothetical protein CC80DRAFT_488209 [Byssothecium circinans]|uniref:Uncharacterized protein n=1 Tax=Byssothecium circinans TaxID=147558 RepID=A0A6A5UCX7_9PLEO|nr:hypothetical protein CC80DRAFT_488209 [Byssothecium circinans]
MAGDDATATENDGEQLKQQLAEAQARIKQLEEEEKERIREGQRKAVENDMDGIGKEEFERKINECMLHIEAHTTMEKRALQNLLLTTFQTLCPIQDLRYNLYTTTPEILAAAESLPATTPLLERLRICFERHPGHVQSALLSAHNPTDPGSIDLRTFSQAETSVSSQVIDSVTSAVHDVREAIQTLGMKLDVDQQQAASGPAKFKKEGGGTRAACALSGTASGIASTNRDNAARQSLKRAAPKSSGSHRKTQKQGPQGGGLGAEQSGSSDEGLVPKKPRHPQSISELSPEERRQICERKKKERARHMKRVKRWQDNPGLFVVYDDRQGEFGRDANGRPFASNGRGAMIDMSDERHPHYKQ